MVILQLLNARLDRETDADKKDMLTRMKTKMDTSLNTAKSVIDNRGDGTCQDAARMVKTLFLLLLVCPWRGVNYYDEHVCVCLFTYLKNHSVQVSKRNFLYMLSVAVARSSSNDNAACYVLLVL